MLFGPAGRPLPQLPLTIDADRKLRAAGDCSGPAGPGWWGVRSRREVDDPVALHRPAHRRRAAAATRRCATLFPDHWSFLLGEVALYAFIVLIATGVYLALFFEPEPVGDGLPRVLRAAARRAR